MTKIFKQIWQFLTGNKLAKPPKWTASASIANPTNLEDFASRLNHIAWFQREWRMKHGGQALSKVTEDGLFICQATGEPIPDASQAWTCPLTGNIFSRAYLASWIGTANKPEWLRFIEDQPAAETQTSVQA